MLEFSESLNILVGGSLVPKRNSLRTFLGAASGGDTRMMEFPRFMKNMISISSRGMVSGVEAVSFMGFTPGCLVQSCEVSLDSLRYIVAIITVWE